MKRFLFILLIGILCSIASAQDIDSEDIDSVILTTTVNYPDSFVAAVAANRIGAPVLLTERDEIPIDTRNQLNELKPTTIYIIGGPSVIGTGVEDSLKGEGYEVIRIWGITRYGTSTEVAQYFWVEGSEKAVLVWDKTGTAENGNEDMLVMAKDLAQANDAPLLISARNTLPSIVEESLKNLNLEEIILVGDFSESVKSSIRDLGIGISDDITGNRTRIRDRIRAKIKNLTRNMDRNETPLVIIAVGNWTDTIKAPFHPGRGISRLISNEDEIPDVIKEIKEENYTRIIVVGKPDLAQQICDALTAEGIEHDCLTGNASKVAAMIARLERSRIQKLQEKFRERLPRILEKLEERAREIREECVNFFDLANVTITDLETNLTNVQEYKNRVRELNLVRKECMQAIAGGNLTKARNRLQQLKSDVKSLRWEIRDLIREEIKEETDAETVNAAEIAAKIRERVQEVSRIREELLGVRNELAEKCRERVEEIEELEKRGQYSRIHERIKIALRECADVRKGKGITTTTEAVTTTSTSVEVTATTTSITTIPATTMKGHRGR